MKKFMNGLDAMLHESLAGFAHCHRHLVMLDPHDRFVCRRELTPGKVALISGGGSGHEPLHVGFVGRGMLDAACPGQIFTSPAPNAIVAAARAVDTGSGCLFIVKNYEGDAMNFAMAVEILGDNVRTVVVDDDVSITRSASGIGRRGVAGTLVVEKLVGAAAESGTGLAALAELGARVSGATRTMGVALTSCTVPAAGRPTLALGDDQIEIGVGIHGEAGQRRAPLAAADDIAREMVAATSDDLQLVAGSQILLLVNGFGATPASELYLMYDAARRALANRDVVVSRSLVGSYVTSLDMAGCSITLTHLDAELTQLWDAAIDTPALRWGAVF